MAVQGQKTCATCLQRCRKSAQGREVLPNWTYCAPSWLRAQFSKIKKSWRESLLVSSTSTVRAYVASLKSCAWIKNTTYRAEWHSQGGKGDRRHRLLHGESSCHCRGLSSNKWHVKSLFGAGRARFRKYCFVGTFPCALRRSPYSRFYMRINTVLVVFIDRS